VRDNKMAHSIKLSDEAYNILLGIAKDEGRSVTKQIEVWARKFKRPCPTSKEEDEFSILSSREAYIEALEQARRGDVIHVGTFETIEELDEKLGI
jgi:hypothetical protein